MVATPKTAHGVMKAGTRQPIAPAGHGAVRVACGTYDFAKQGGLKVAYKLGVTLPAGAIVIDSAVDVLTTCQTASADAGTMAISIETANDIVTATAVSAGGNIWDKGVHAGVPVGTAATAIKLTADRTLTATIATQAFTAGKFNVWLWYLD